MADVTPKRKALKVQIDEVVDRALEIDAAESGISKRQLVEDALRKQLSAGSMKKAAEILRGKAA